MKQYLDLLDKILKEGKHRNDRTGTGTIGIFGHEMRFDMKQGFPLLTTKKLHLKSIIYELLWFLQGGTNIKYLNDNGVTIWDEWADSNGNLGPIYGYQWRNWRRYILTNPNTGIDAVAELEKMLIPNANTTTELYNVEHIDQIANIIKTLKNNPDNRRMLVLAWNVGELEDMLFPPCHYGFQVCTFKLTIAEREKLFRVKYGENLYFMLYSLDGEEGLHKEYDKYFIPRRSISLRWDQRSVDTFLGLSYNIASYALLLLMLAQVVNMEPNELSCSLGDTHITITSINVNYNYQENQDHCLK